MVTIDKSQIQNEFLKEIVNLLDQFSQGLMTEQETLTKIVLTGLGDSSSVSDRAAHCGIG